MNFFFDNCISPKLARAIHQLVLPEHRVVPLREMFESHTPDIDWLQTLGGEGGWIVISGDMRIRKRPKERDVWKAARLTTFFMADGFQEVGQWEQVRWMIDKWPLIADQAAKVTPGAAFIVPKRGNKLSQA